ncbi:transcriptional regulator [Candidatus Marinamargulisbacteria bacterium SCGC AG-410-N11]|nr:transcriptional regulator [Candidatus Marinamargulisbacteria bacterium SCGC AG-410-N11]
MNVPLLDLQRQYQDIESTVMSSIQDVFNSKIFINGPKVTQLETDIAAYCGTKHAIGVSSGTDALIISLMALDIQPGDEIITTPFTFFATAGSISRLGAVPVFVDIDPLTYNIDPNLIEAKITSKTKVIMPVHLFGQLADMNQIMAIAKKHNLHVIEDAAQAIGAKTTYNGKPLQAAGSIGDLGCFSFFPSKNLGCCGDGGVVTTNSDDLYEKCQVLRAHGSKPKYYHHIIGGNFRLDAIQAAVVSAKLPFLNDQHEGRIKNATYYNQHLHQDIKTPVVSDGSYMIYNQYTIQHEKRDQLMDVLQEYTIGHAIYYPVPLHLQGCFSHLGYQEGNLPVSEKAAKEVVSIPVFPELTQSELDYTVAVINQFIESN